jgi:hypothetical protein
MYQYLPFFSVVIITDVELEYFKEDLVGKCVDCNVTYVAASQ